jgi:DNA repair exonuclease SbcCD ATPase subunit
MENKQLINVTPVNYEKAVQEFTQEESKAADLCLMDARKMVIKNDEDCKTAMESFVIARNRINDLEGKRTSITGPLGDVVKKINDLFRSPADKLKEARDTYNNKATAYRREQEEKRLEAERQARLKAEAEEKRKREEKERQEREWRAKEAKAKEEAAALARKAANERNEANRADMEAQAEKALQEAAKAQEKANERAQQAAEVFVAPKVVEKTEVKVAGFRAKSVKWYAKVINPAQVPAEFAGRKLWVVDEKALNDLATALKTGECPIPGVRFYSE